MWCSAIGCIVLLILSLLVAPLAAEAQPYRRCPGSAFLCPCSRRSEPHNLEAFRHRLRELGWMRARTSRWSCAMPRQAPTPSGSPPWRLTWSDSNVDVIVTVGGTTHRPGARHAIPIVMVTAGDPVEAGFVTSLAQPGGNITGLAGLGAELSGKRLEILTQAVPQLSRVALLLNPTNVSVGYVRETQVAAQALGVALQVLEVRRPEDIEGAFAAMQQAGAGASSS